MIILTTNLSELTILLTKVIIDHPSGLVCVASSRQCQHRPSRQFLTQRVLSHQHDLGTPSYGLQLWNHLLDPANCGTV